MSSIYHFTHNWNCKLYTSYNLVSDAVEEKNVPAEVNDTVLEASNANATLNETGILGLNGTVSNTSQVENSTKTKLNDETVNSTSANSGLPKWFCKGRNNSQSNETLQQKVVIVNSEELLKLINATTDNETDSCAVVLFFTQYCPFCAKLAPLYNALGRVYNSLPILAIDAYKQHRWETVLAYVFLFLHFWFWVSDPKLCSDWSTIFQ